MSDPYERDNISITMKQDGKDGTWIVFHGSPAKVREQVIEVFQLENEWETPLFDLINAATRLYKSTGNISSQLGGRVITKTDRTSESGNQSSGSAWDRAGGSSEPAEPEVDPNVVRLSGAIESAQTRAELKELFARNKAVFDANADLTDEWKSKGKSLPA